MKTFTASLLFIVFFQTIIAQNIFNEHHIIDHTLPSNDYYNLVTGDIDNDGIIDVLVYSYTKVYLYKGHGYGQFSDRTTLIDQGGDITLIDSDDDQDLDLFRFKGNILYEYINDGQGNYSSPSNIYDAGSGGTLICGDVDNDGDVDLVKRKWYTVAVEHAKLYYIENLGDNNFADEIIFFSVSSYYDAYATASFSDIFDTGNLDLVILSYEVDINNNYESNVDVGRYDGTSFSIISGVNQYLFYINPADLDGDGQKELMLYTSYSDQEIYKLQNYGNGFGDKQLIANGNKLLLAYDINNDNLSDLVIISEGQLMWCQNSNGSFYNYYDIMNFQANNYFEFFQADVNGDGYSDILYIDDENTKIGWISNQPSTMFFFEEDLCDNDSLFFGDQWITEEGVYQDSLTSVFGLDSIINLSISILPAPNDFEIYGANEVLPNTAEAYTAPVNSNINYEWTVEGGDIISNPLNNAITVLWGDAASGTVTAIASYDNSCQTTSNLFVTNINAINDISRSDISISPNPVQNYLYINTDKKFQFTVYNQYGKELINTREKRIDVSGLADGIYFIVLRDRDERLIYQKKFIKKS